MVDIIDTSSVIGVILERLVNMSGSLFLALMFIELFFVVLALALRLPIELAIPLILPILLVAVALTSNFYTVLGVALIYLAILMAKSVFFNY